MLGHFRVQPRVIQILGNQYRSSEEALKELVANAWDADATRVDIALPLALTGQPIVIRDNGCGMTEHELRAQYLEVAFDRRKAMGETTQRGRKVRGQLGIGKFGGFVLANRMTVATVARGTRCQLTLDREDLLTRDQDLEGVDLPIQAEPCNDASGTTVELSLLKPGYEQPSPKKVGALLLHEFGVPDEFAVYIDGVRLTPDILEGTKVQLDLQVGGGPGGNDLTRWRALPGCWTSRARSPTQESLCA